MLATAAFVLMPKGIAKSFFPRQVPAKENVLQALLELPAPPPPNPLEAARARDDSFYDPKNPPPDNAPIDELMDYWSHQSENYRGVLFYLPRPSERVLQRLLNEGGSSTVANILNVLADDKSTGDVVKQIYDDPSTPKELKGRLRNWLTQNSSYFIDDTERSASDVKDVGTYVSVPNQTALLALTRHDWDVAKPIVDRLYNDGSQPVSHALATWALYRHAMESGDLGDTARYRSELMRIVENRQLSDGVRDMANDAIVREPDFPGRDEWCWSLFEDETLVNMPSFTGLTTLVMYAPPEKYVPKMIELLKSNNKTVRTAAARNLITAFDREKNPEIVRVLLPWIGDPKWIDKGADDSTRAQLVMSLQNIKMPESVPVLITALDEKATRPVEDVISTAANSMSNAANTSFVITNTNRSNSARGASTKAVREQIYFPLRDYAVRALTNQADARAIPALRRVLAVTTGYQRSELFAALLACGGYSDIEQVDALEKYARKASDAMFQARVLSYGNSNANVYLPRFDERIVNSVQTEDSEELLGALVASSKEPSEQLARMTIDRIDKLGPNDPATARALRQIILTWKGLAVSTLFLHDLKNGKAETEAIVRLLAERKLLRERLPQDVSDIHNGTPTAAGISACLTDEQDAYAGILDSRSLETRTALLACSRLVRAELPLSKVAENLNSADPLLKSAAELYLEAEDSPQARSLIFNLHPGDTKILGATAFFKGKGESASFSPELISLFASVSSSGVFPPYTLSEPFSVEFEKTESRLRKEIKENADLLGIYSYKENFIRIYKDRVVYSWEDDPSRYHERDLRPEEFSSLKSFFVTHHVTDLKPFLSCSGGCSNPRELVMLGRIGGNRVYVNSDRSPAFFVGLEKLFADFRVEPSVIKYALSKDVPGLELLFASDDLEAQTVWKQGSDLRVVVSDRAVREKIDEEISQAEDSEEQDDAPDEGAADEQGPEPVAPSETMRQRRKYESLAWHRIENGRLGEQTAQPPGVEYIPPRDGLEVQADEQQWKARTAAFEIRADSTGLYKVATGRVIKLKAGYYSDPVVSSNGRWLVVDKFQDDEGPVTVRYDLLTNREYKIAFIGYGNLLPRCFIPAVGKFLLVAGYYDNGYYESGGDDEESPDGDTPVEKRFYLLDAETGALSSANGEMRPLSAQSFRPLQPTGKPNEFWAALPSSTTTLVGTYDAKLFKFKTVLRLPKINFSSMDQWVDEAGNKVYFVYSGHLLSVPLRLTPPK
jgi:hypothetical protein